MGKEADFLFEGTRSSELHSRLPPNFSSVEKRMKRGGLLLAGEKASPSNTSCKVNFTYSEEERGFSSLGRSLLEDGWEEE